MRAVERRDEPARPGVAQLLLVRFAVVLCSLLVAAGTIGGCGGDEPSNPGGDASSGPAGAPEIGGAEGFAGEWDSTFGRLRLEATGASVEGTYTFCDGTLSGTADGERLEGTWEEDTSACDDPESAARPVADGTFSFTLDPGGDRFTGYYETKGSPERNDWSGTRVDGG